MNRKEYVDYISTKKIDDKLVKEIIDKYDFDLPEIVKLIVSNAKDTLFFDDEYRVLSFDEIIDAEKDLHVSFSEKKIIPLFDCGENDFIVYNSAEGIWSKFNIVDETFFKKKEKLSDLL